jgi:hypothetical protein
VIGDSKKNAFVASRMSDGLRSTRNERRPSAPRDSSTVVTTGVTARKTTIETVAYSRRGVNAATVVEIAPRNRPMRLACARMGRISPDSRPNSAATSDADSTRPRKMIVCGRSRNTRRPATTPKYRARA